MSQNTLGAAPKTSASTSARVIFTSCSRRSYSASSRMKARIADASAGTAVRMAALMPRVSGRPIPVDALRIALAHGLAAVNEAVEVSEGFARSHPQQVRTDGALEE